MKRPRSMRLVVGPLNPPGKLIRYRTLRAQMWEIWHFVPLCPTVPLLQRLLPGDAAERFFARKDQLTPAEWNHLIALARCLARFRQCGERRKRLPPEL